MTVSDKAKLPTGICLNMPFCRSGFGMPPVSFTYYYWNDIKGYIENYVNIFRGKVGEYVNISDIDFKETEKVLIPLPECPEMARTTEIQNTIINTSITDENFT